MKSVATVLLLGAAACGGSSYEESLNAIVNDCDATRYASVYGRPYEGMSPFIVDFFVEADQAQPFADCIFSAARTQEIEAPTIISGSEHTQTILSPTLVGQTD